MTPKPLRLYFQEIIYVLANLICSLAQSSALYEEKWYIE